MATVYQRCKSDKRSVNYPCTKTRCGHDWTVRYRPGGRTGGQREQSFEKKSLAEAFATKVENDKNEGTYLDLKRGEITVRAYAEDWLSRQVIGESTHSNYESFIRLYLVPQLGTKTIAGVRRKNVEAFVASVRKELAASTICDRMKMVSNIFRTAVKEKRRPDDPTEGVKFPRPGTKEVDEDEIPTLDEVELIAKQISPRYKLTVYLQAAAGLRISEALAFATDCRRGDFIRIRRQVSAKANREDSGHASSRSSTAPRGSTGTSLCPPSSARRSIPTCKSGEPCASGPWWCSSRRESGGKGTMPTATTYAYHFRKALKEAGLTAADGKPKYTPHCLRHFFASTALANGIPIHEVSHWLGHRSIKTTVDVYGHLVPGAWSRCREIMQGALRPGCPQSPSDQRD
ncbi:tyrosine-type recombinase/integrase [Streptomyces sioyaensis]|uniref:tyrosine-type recombinase/integrase n=1 Tax=Streptomyces sioyaensis TaxID=67364 RepID=UPI00379B7602